MCTKGSQDSECALRGHKGVSDSKCAPRGPQEVLDSECALKGPKEVSDFEFASELSHFHGVLLGPPIFPPRGTTGTLDTLCLFRGCAPGQKDLCFKKRVEIKQGH